MRIYCNSDIITQLDIIKFNKGNAALSERELDGKIVTTFRGVPVRRVDALLSTEDVVE
jgi:hypothetical protein